MDAFEQSIGYRSIVPDLSPPEQQAFEQLSEENLLQVAQNAFDALLAEALRSVGVWHWELDSQALASEIAEMLSFRVRSRSEHLRAMLLHYYAERYRRPGVQEYRAYLRGKKKAGVLTTYEARQQEMLLALLVYAKVRSWADGRRGTDSVGVAGSMHYNPLATYLDEVDPYRVHHVTCDVVVAVVLGGHCEYRCSTPLWACMVLQQLAQRGGNKRVTAAEFLMYLVKLERWIVAIQKGIVRRRYNHWSQPGEAGKKGEIDEHETL